jgi:competence protein ComEC
MKNLYLLFLGCIFICGIVLASLAVFAFLEPASFFAIIAILLGALTLFRKRDTLFILLLCLLVLLLGGARYNVHNRIDKSNIKNYRKAVLVKGEVVSDPEESRAGKKRTFILEAGWIKTKTGAEKVSGFALVNAYDRKAFRYRYGDIIVLEGVLSRPFSYYNKSGKFDYRTYLADKRIYCVLNAKKGSFSEKVGEDKGIVRRIVRGIYSIRKKLEIHIEKYLDPPESSVLLAILLGKRRAIPKGITDCFARTGTLHILAISGLHVGIIYFALKVILKILRAGRKLSVILTVLFLACFAVMTGARPSILRAAAMFSILAFSGLLRRRIGIFNLIGLSCLVILIANPNQVFNAGFILSYAAVLSIVGIAPLLYRIFSIGTSKLKRPCLVSLAVFVGLMPLMAYYFGLITPIVVAANLIVIPLLILVMGSGLLFITLGLLSRVLALLFSQSAWVFLIGLINSVKLLEMVPFGHFEVKPPRLWVVIAYYIGLCSFIILMNRRAAFRKN